MAGLGFRFSGEVRRLMDRGKKDLVAARDGQSGRFH
jgi:hypothetical protein